MAADDLLTRAASIADHVLFPAALDTDQADRIPATNLDALAAAGFYGLFSPREIGGLEADPTTAFGVIERLASGCLTTAFTWLQHLGASVAVAMSDQSVRDQFGAAMANGTTRAGVAFAHLRRADPPPLVAETSPAGWRLRGTAPWVSGWGMIDVVHVGARHGNDVVWLLVDASEQLGLSVRRLDLAAVNASHTVTAEFDLVIPGDRFVQAESFATWRARDALNLRPNGSLALGITRRCARLLDDPAWTTKLEVDRARLDAAAAEALPSARAAATLSALHAAAAVVAAGSGRSIVRDSHAQRLAREALFLLVQGQNPAIRAAQLEGLAPTT